ncbi:DUF6634 family protein [Agrobacterium sp. CCNWLW32]|uniref:DUF6634 family protein n=1 Tax=Agrobacterium sp. CCNWLW32 TaxID=3122072 RepID=UPI003010383D
MLIEKFNGPPPSETELSVAPVVDRWQLLPNDNGTTDVSGFVSGHHSIPDGAFAVTSALVQIDPSTPPKWVRSRNRVYRLGRSAGAVESQVRELARDRGVRPREWDILAYTKAIEGLSGHGEGQIDIIEQLIALLLLCGFVNAEAGQTLLTTYRKERAQC